MKNKRSINYRLAVNLAISLLVIGIILFPVFLSARLRSVSLSCEEIADQFVYSLTQNENTADLPNKAILPDTVSVRITSVEKGREIYRIGQRPKNPSYFHYSLRKTDGKLRLYVKLTQTITYTEEECKAVYYFDCYSEGKMIAREYRTLLIWYLFLVTILVLLFYALNKAVLLPINELTKKVQEMNIQTIHKERIDVSQTETELQNFAEEINHMLDRLEQAYEDQKQFVSEASHELRTPITVLQGYSSMLRRWGADDKEVLAESVEAIESEAKSMQELVEKLLFLSRHERRKLPFSKERFDMQEMIEELHKEMEYTLKDTRIVKCESEPVSVYGDKQALKQALRVFLDNARKYSSDGDTISISCKNKQGSCEIKVEDTGLGMQQKDMDGIFNRFFRADTVRGKNIEGHGLGLSIARLIIDGHAGKITVRSQFTKGSSFIITLPRQRG